jgi:hypothetical protein
MTSIDFLNFFTDGYGEEDSNARDARSDTFLFDDDITVLTFPLLIVGLPSLHFVVRIRALGTSCSGAS